MIKSLLLSLFAVLVISTLTVESRPTEDKDTVLQELDAELRLINAEIYRRKAECPECYLDVQDASVLSKRTELGQSSDFYRYLGMGKRSRRAGKLPSIRYRGKPDN